MSKEQLLCRDALKTINLTEVMLINKKSNEKVYEH